MVSGICWQANEYFVLRVHVLEVKMVIVNVHLTTCMTQRTCC